jgi:glutamate formiminotransferase
MQQAYDAVLGQARRLGCDVSSCEIVGLVPRQALDTTAPYFQRLERFSDQQILENRLAGVIGGKTVTHAA